MKNLFLLYACAEKFRAAKIDAINVSLSPKASMAEFHAAKREDAMKFLKFLGARRFGLRAAERRFEILKFLIARYFDSHKQAAEFLKFTSELLRNRSEILKFTLKLRNRFGILKFMRASAHLADIAQNFISQRGLRILKLICEPLRAPRRVLPNADKAEAGHVEKFSKFDLTGALLNSISLPPRKFKLALLKFASEVPRNRSKILNFMFASYKLRLALRKFTPEPRKIKSTPAVRLNFAFNSVLHARAAKFENGVKFKGAAKFERSAR